MLTIVATEEPKKYKVGKKTKKEQAGEYSIQMNID